MLQIGNHVYMSDQVEGSVKEIEQVRWRGGVGLKKYGGI